MPFRLVNTIRLGVKNLLLHKMRSILTMLGIIFGVASVIAMLAIGEGASFEAQEAIKELGSNNVIARSVKPPDSEQTSGGQQGMAVSYGLTYRDAERIRATIPGIQEVYPMRIFRENVRFDTRQIQAQVTGTLPSHIDLLNVPVQRGRFLTEVDQHYRRNVAVISENLAQRLFDFREPIGSEVRIDSHYYRVVGVVADQRQSNNSQAATRLSQSEDFVYIPLSVARSRFGELIVRVSSGSREFEQVELHQITVRFDDVSQVEVASEQIRTLLRSFHDKNDYQLIVPLQLLQQAEQTKRIFNIVLGSIAALSLLVGGIGIMNIMLATVTERTREIGVRRALGAKKGDIVTQFLVETIVLSVGGGVIGLAIGIFIPVAVAMLTNMVTIITVWSLGLAFGISVFIGIIFGLYPASRAANMDPIEALRHE
jgi:putative ABC transport system permease protein